MKSKDILNIDVDLEKGEYVLSRYDGEQTIIRPINSGEKRDYQRTYMNSRRKEIIGSKYVPKEREKQIDVGLYDALSEFDEKYGTDYAKKYFEITIEQVPYSGLSEKNRDRKIRARINKMAMFIEARMNINYNANIFNMSKSLNIFDRLQAIRVALAQKVNGIQVNLNKPKKSQNILPEYTETTSQEELEIAEILEDMRAERAKIKSTVEELSNQIPDDSQEESIKTEEELFTQRSDASQEENEVLTANEKPEEVDTEVEAETKATTTYEPKAKKTVSRAKSRQAYKKAAREAKKIKNMYQTKQKDNTRPVKTQEQIQAEARARKQAKVQKNAEAMRIARQQAAEAKKIKEEQERAEKERIEREEQAKKDAKLSSRVKRIILGKKDSEVQEERIVKRFTRKLKDQRDSIRNKIHISKATKRTLAGAAGAVCIVVAIGLGIAGFGNNETSKTEASQPIVESIYDISTETTASSESQSPEEKDYTEAIKQAIRFEENGQVQTGETITKTEESAPVVEENTEKTEESAPIVEESTEKDGEETTATDSSKEYLSSVKVGATMNIERGKYFECPDGTGNYGYFENQEGAKEISIIGVSTNEGYFAITDSNVNLYELKQQYPDAKFSYHFICRYEDGSTKTLGWLTENSIEQNIDNTRQQQSVEEER